MEDKDGNRYEIGSRITGKRVKYRLPKKDRPISLVLR